MAILLPKLGRPIWVLLSGVLFVHLGTFLLLPFFPVVLTSAKKLTLGQTGLVIGAGSIAYLVGSLLGGVLSDRFGPKLTMIIGLLIRGGGLLLLAWADSFYALFLINLVSGIGDGLYMPPAKAGIASFASEGTKTAAFSYRGIAANIGVTLGPLIGTLLLHQGPGWLFTGAAVVYTGLAVAHLLLLERDCVGPECREKTRVPLRALLQDRPFLIYSAVTILLWTLFAQFTLSLPLRAQQIQAARNIGVIWTVTSLIVIVLQTPLTRLFAKRLHPLRAMATGTVLIALALGSVAFSSSFWHLFASAAVFTFGNMLVMPTSDAIVSDLATEDRMGLYFGISAFVFGAGEALGNIGGGQLMQAAEDIDYLAMPWLLYGVTGVALGIAYFLLAVWTPLAGPLEPVLEERTRSLGFKRKKQKT